MFHFCYCFVVFLYNYNYRSVMLLHDDQFKALSFLWCCEHITLLIIMYVILPGISSAMQLNFGV